MGERCGPDDALKYVNFYAPYVEKIDKESDRQGIGRRSCAKLLEKDELTDDEAVEAAGAARTLLVHVSNCDGLAILSERFSDEELDDLAEKFQADREQGVSLLDWADTIRSG